MGTRKLAFYGVAVLLAGCVPVVSLHPLFTKESIVFEEKLLGTWVQDANRPQVTWEFARLEAEAAERVTPEMHDQVQKCYRLSMRDDKGRTGSFAACLVKLQNHLFLDVVPDRFPSDEVDAEQMKLAYNAYFFVPVHTFVKVDVIGEQLQLRLTDDEEFKKLVETEPNAVRYDTLDDRPVLTAPTAEIQAFVTKYAGNERLFPNKLTLTRPRP